MLTAPTVAAAAKASGIAERSLRRWLTDPAFRDAYRAESRRCLEDALGQLRAISGEAVVTLREALTAESASVRVRAALGVLDAAVKADLDELAARVEALEELQRTKSEWR